MSLTLPEMSLLVRHYSIGRVVQAVVISTDLVSEHIWALIPVTANGRPWMCYFPSLNLSVPLSQTGLVKLTLLGRL